VETSRIVTASLLAVSLIPLASPQPRPQPQKVFVGRYCAGCHNEKSPAGGLALSRFANEDMAAHPEVWEKVVRRLRARSMPPAGLPRPDETGYSAIVSSLEASSTATQPPTRIRGAPTPSAA
jgi:mono/diheme cytochrome c family protein